jgi:hypothetical protein
MIASQPTPVLNRPRKSGPKIDVSTYVAAAQSPEIEAQPAVPKNVRAQAARLARQSGEYALAAIVLAGFAPAILLMHLARWLDSE